LRVEGLEVHHRLQIERSLLEMFGVHFLPYGGGGMFQSEFDVCVWEIAIVELYSSCT
jgi:hypothetical protein